MLNFNDLLDWIDDNISALERDREYYENRRDENPLPYVKEYWQFNIDEADYDIDMYENIRSCVVICQHKVN